MPTAMSYRGQWSEHEARGVLSAWRRSGETLQRFALNRGIVPQRMRWWKKRLEQPQQPPIALVPVQVTDSSSTSESSSTTKRGEPVAVFLRSGHIVKVGRGFDEEAFARVVALLEGG